MSTANQAVIEKFVEDCKSLDGNGIYELFSADEDNIRVHVFDFACISLGVDLDSTPEPTRASLIALGEHFNVQSLIDY